VANSAPLVYDFLYLMTYMAIHAEVYDQIFSDIDGSGHRNINRQKALKELKILSILKCSLLPTLLIFL